MAALPDLSLGAFIEAVAADRPAPGAGAAGGVTLALAAACAAKAFRISARHRHGDPALTEAADQAEALARAALAGAERDAEDFTALVHAHRHDGEAERALHDDGVTLLALAAELRRLVETHRGAVIEDMAGDVVAALALSHAAERVHRRNLSEIG